MSSSRVARAVEPDTNTLIRDVDRLVHWEQELHREQMEWDTQRQTLEHHIRLLEHEKETLEARIAETKRVLDEESQEAVALEERRARQERVLRDAGHTLAATEKNMAAARAAVPEGMRDELPAERSAEGSVTERLRAVLAVASEIHRIDQSLHHQRQLMDVPDVARIQMDVLYIGLAQAFAVSIDNRYAGRGIWSGEEWVWTWNRTWAPTIRQAIHIHQGEQPPRWVRLPLAVAGDVDP